MTPDNESELERIVAAELRQLPLPRAPETLLPRVMQAVEAAGERAWYAGPWLTWPVAAQLASIAIVAVLAYAGWRVPHAPPSVVAAMSTARVLWEALIQPLLPYLVAVMVLMGLACVVFGAALNYVLLERVEQRR